MNNKLQTKFKEAQESPGFIFWKVANIHQKLQRQALRDLDITPTQFSLLACYFFMQKPDFTPSQADVSLHSGLDKMLVSDTTKSLLKKKLVTKRINKEDRRAFLIELTENGKRVCNEAVKRIEKLDAEFFSLTQNAKSFHSMLKKIIITYDD